MVNTAELIRIALAEDLYDRRDMTSDLFVDAKVEGNGWIEAREDAVMSGLEIARQVFLEIDPSLKIQLHAAEGAEVHAMEKVLEVSGRAGSILRAERTALNFLGHLSGVATRTREFVRAANSERTKILATRKTTPGLRDLEIAAVRHGGGDVYRTNLSDAVLIKDNHLGIAGGLKGIADRLNRIQTADAAQYAALMNDGKIEVSSLTELDEAVAMGWQQILLDNFNSTDVGQAVKKWGAQVYLEVSGGVNMGNIGLFSAAGPHAISIGAITHSVKAIDFSLEVEWRHI